MRIAIVLACAAGGCLHWDSLYGTDAPGDTDSPGAATGCADGTREGLATYSSIAACAGAWTVPGVIGDAPPACARQAGNDGSNAAGTGCNVADLCATGWHVCN